jgi:hypothetical protein
MELVTALQMYGYQSVEDVKIEVTTRVYRRLVKENHPDNVENPRYLVGDITDAREILNRVASGAAAGGSVGGSGGSSFGSSFNSPKSSESYTRSYNSQSFTRANDFRQGNYARYVAPYHIMLEQLQDLFHSGRVYYGDDNYFVLDNGSRRTVYIVFKVIVEQGGERVEYSFPKKVSETNKYQLSLSLEKEKGSAVVEVYGSRFEVSRSIRSLKVQFSGVTIMLDVMF